MNCRKHYLRLIQASTDKFRNNAYRKENFRYAYVRLPSKPSVCPKAGWEVPAGSRSPTRSHKHNKWNEVLLLGSRQSPLPKGLVQKIKAFQKEKLSFFL